jgi:hypothetical protein
MPGEAGEELSGVTEVELLLLVGVSLAFDIELDDEPLLVTASDDSVG